MKKQFAAALNTLTTPFGISVNRTKDLDRLKRKNVALSHMVLSGIDAAGPNTSAFRTEGILVSKDRALQLHALLQSYAECVKNPAPLHLLYAASSERHARAYEEVIDRNRSVLLTTEKEFDYRAQIIAVLDRITAPTAFFLVDDIVFIRPVDFAVFSGLSCRRFVTSLRLAPHLRYCYTLDKDQPVPDLKPHESGLLVWQWKDGAFDWNYPLSHDCHFFDTGELRAMTRCIDFSGPNSYEHGLQEFNDVFLPRYGACFPEARIVNLPMNRVQNENDNRSGGIHQDRFLDQWEKGMRLDHRALYGAMTNGAHQLLPFTFIKRAP
jgi:hypothetical protein